MRAGRRLGIYDSQEMVGHGLNRFDQPLFLSHWVGQTNANNYQCQTLHFFPLECLQRLPTLYVGAKTVFSKG